MLRFSDFKIGMPLFEEKVEAPTVLSNEMKRVVDPAGYQHGRLPVACAGVIPTTTHHGPVAPRCFAGQAVCAMFRAKTHRRAPIRAGVLHLRPRGSSAVRGPVVGCCTHGTISAIDKA